jgi:hypothetical protein
VFVFVVAAVVVVVASVLSALVSASEDVRIRASKIVLQGSHALTMTIITSLSS